MFRRRAGAMAVTAILLAAMAGCGGSDGGAAVTDAAPPVAVTPAVTSPAATTAGQISASPHASPSSRPSPVPSAGRTSAKTVGSAGPTASGLKVPKGWRTMTLVNRLDETIWPAIAADPAHPISRTGWVLQPGASLSFAIPDHWDVRLWARTGCKFDSAGRGKCLSGDCGKLQCGSTWGEFPSTLAEFNLNAWNGMDFYDVSLVEGNNLPMWINSYGKSSKDRIDSNGCSAAGCTRDANRTCPAKLQRVRGGKVVACLSACLVFNDDQTCCTAAFAPRSKCVPSSWPINSAAVFKKAEPFAYSYVNDDETSVLTCTGECDYRVTWGVSS